MPHTTVATGTFSSRKAADQAVRRLVSGGFSRNSIELHQHEEGEGYDLEIHTRPRNMWRAERLMHGGSLASAMSFRNMGHTASGAVQTARSYPLVLLGAGVLAGFVLYNLIPRSEQEAASRKRTSHSRRHSHSARR